MSYCICRCKCSLFLCTSLRKAMEAFLFRNITPDREETMIQHGLRQRIVHIFRPNGAFRSRRTNKSLKTKLIFFHRLARTHFISSFSIGPPFSLWCPHLSAVQAYIAENCLVRVGVLLLGNNKSICPPSPTPLLSILHAVTSFKSISTSPSTGPYKKHTGPTSR